MLTFNWRNARELTTLFLGIATGVTFHAAYLQSSWPWAIPGFVLILFVVLERVPKSTKPLDKMGEATRQLRRCLK